MLMDLFVITGRAAREEEAPQGPCHEAPKVHPPFCQRYHDRWQAEGMLGQFWVPQGVRSGIYDVTFMD